MASPNNVVKFPGKLPTLDQLELPRAQLCLLLSELAKEITKSQLALMASGNAVEFAAAVRKTADKLAVASTGWAEMSVTIRKSWGI
jgi:hypothetical protein